MSTSIDASLWPASQLGAAMAALARAERLAIGRAESPSDPGDQVLANRVELAHWIERVAAHLGFEVAAVASGYESIPEVLSEAGPALFCVQGSEGPPRVLLLVRGNAKSVTLLGPDFALRRVRVSEVSALFCDRLEQRVSASVDRTLNASRLSARSRPRARAAVLRERLKQFPFIAEGWMFRQPASRPLGAQLRETGLRSKLLLLGAAHLSHYALMTAAWWILGRGALEGRLERGWLMAWALMMFTLAGLRVFAIRTQAMVALDFGTVLKRRLMAGALMLLPEEMRGQGAGQLLGRVMESEAVESLTLSGGLLAIVAAFEVLVASIILAIGAGGFVHVSLLVIWTALMLVAGARFTRARGLWTDVRLDMTHGLVERMVGHRTRLAQEAPERWHEGEDEALGQYLAASHGMDD